MPKGPKTPINVDPKTLFLYAQAFSDAVEYLAPQMKRAANPLTAGVIPSHPDIRIAKAAETAPFMMVDTFALELYLKCLYAMDHGTLAWGHDITVIYRGLKRRTKSRLRDNYAELVATSPLLPTMQKRARYGFSDFYSYLKRSNHSFEEVRYLFERESVRKRGIRYWPLLRWAARKSVLDIMPEWGARSEPAYLLL